MKYIFPLLALPLAGCATTASVLDKNPTEVYTLADSANEVAFCLANKNNTSALDRDDGSKIVLVKNGYGGVAMAFSIFPTDDGGSRVEHRKQFGVIGAIWKQCLGLDD